MPKVISPFESVCVVGEVTEEHLGAAALALLRSGSSRVTITGNYRPGYDPEDVKNAKRLQRQQPKLLASPDKMNGDSEMRESDQKVLRFLMASPDTEFPPRFIVKSTKLALATVTACLVRLVAGKHVVKAGYGRYKLNGEHANA